jgi:hypothetical protein
MGDLAATAGARGSAAEGARLGRARDFICRAMEPFLASWQTLAGLAWLAGRITRGSRRVLRRCCDRSTPIGGRSPRDASRESPLLAGYRA